MTALVEPQSSEPESTRLHRFGQPRQLAVMVLGIFLLGYILSDFLPSTTALSDCSSRAATAGNLYEHRLILLALAMTVVTSAFIWYADAASSNTVRANWLTTTFLGGVICYAVLSAFHTSLIGFYLFAAALLSFLTLGSLPFVPVVLALWVLLARPDSFRLIFISSWWTLLFTLPAVVGLLAHPLTSGCF